MSNGYLREVNGKYSGKIITMEHDIDFTLKLVVSDNERAPAFDVMAKSPRGQEFKIGAVFEKTNRQTGEVFYSFSIDDPSLGKPLYVTAFGAKDRAGEFDIVWNRPRVKEVA